MSTGTGIGTETHAGHRQAVQSQEHEHPRGMSKDSHLEETVTSWRLTV
jgi:hypothetical protein